MLTLLTQVTFHGELLVGSNLQEQVVDKLVIQVRGHVLLKRLLCCASNAHVKAALLTQAPHNLSPPSLQFALLPKPNVNHSLLTLAPFFLPAV